MMKPVSLPVRGGPAAAASSRRVPLAIPDAAPSWQRRSGSSSSSSSTSSAAVPSQLRRVAASWSRGQDSSAAGGGHTAGEDALQVPAETFYDLLNVPPTASRRAIRQAYLDMMKECHPDRSNAEAHELCVLINEVYETLSDPQKRAAYDAISGLSVDSINPFTDTTHERDQVFVDEVTCIGCRNCANVCPSSFKIEDFHGRARVTRQNADTPEKLQEAIDTCPVSCIHWVSAPQLALLEQAMARMERVAVWSMFMGSGSAKDVFLEASLAWEKRQANARRVRAAAAAASSGNSAGAPPWAQWWGNMTSSAREGAAGSRFYEGVNKARGRWGSAAAAADDGGSAGSSDEDWAGAGGEGGEGQRQQQPLSEKQARGIATLAARAARASRTWRSMQEATQRLRNRPLQLAAVSARGGEDVVVVLDGEPGGSSSSSSSMSSVSDS